MAWTGPSFIMNGGEGGVNIHRQKRLHPGGVNPPRPTRTSGARFLVTRWRQLHYTADNGR